MGAYGSTPETGKSQRASSSSSRAQHHHQNGQQRGSPVTVSAVSPTHICDNSDVEEYNATGTGHVTRSMSSSPQTPAGSSSSNQGSPSGVPPNDVFWVEKAEVRIANSGLVPPGHTVKPNVPADKVTPGVEVSMCVPKNPTGMNMFKAMRSEWRTRTVRGGASAAPFSTGMDPDDILDAIEDTPGDMLDPPVHLPYMLDLLADVWEDGGLYD